MAQVITLVLTLVVFVAVVLILTWARGPHYRLTRKNVANLFRLVLEAKATENDWRLFSALPLRHDPYLHNLREQCLEIEEREFTRINQSGFLFTRKGLEEIQELLENLESEPQA
jgi:uncharacterized membrane protein YqjE